MAKLIDMTGKKFGYLTVLKRVENRGSRAWWLCECECGNQKEVSGKSLRSGRTRSCGCFQRESTSQRFKKHGCADEPIYNIWLSMKRRCRSKSDSSYQYYGARGIDYCERWEGFENFLEDMGERPTSHHSLERVDNNKGYCEENCIWADYTTQARNKRVYKTNKTGAAGVFRHKKTNRYHANIRVNGKLLFLGSFKEFEKARKAREIAEKKYFQSV